MKIRILGSGYGECKIKKQASKDFRRRGGVLIDEKILIDAPADLHENVASLGFSDAFDEVFDLIISHSHSGHFSVETILKLAKGRRLRVYASDYTLSLLPDVYEIEKIPTLPFSPIEIGEYKLIALPANHETDSPEELCYNFIISRDKSLLYTLDTGFLSYSAFRTLEGMKIDAIIGDCALEARGACRECISHGNLDSAKAIRDILISLGTCSENVKYILSHIPTDKKRAIHDELSELAIPLGFAVAYDGYFCTI